MRRYREHVTNGLRAADLVVAPSQWMLDAVSRHYLRPEHGAVIYNGRSPELFDPEQHKDDLVLSVGRIWDEGKHVSLLLQAPHPVATKIVGWTQEPGRESRALPLLPPNIELSGPKSEDDLRHIYAKASLYAATSRYEPFGLSPLEAAFSRCALVMNDIPVFHELWGDAAAYFRKDDPADLARVSSELSRNHELREQLSNRAFVRACQKFAAPRMVVQYEDSYQQVVSRTEKVA
jgi:glycosyltransferase involved in cell wall biosynthesis